MSLVSTDEKSNIMETKLACFRRVKFYKIAPPKVRYDSVFIQTGPDDEQETNQSNGHSKQDNKSQGYKESPVVIYEFKPETWTEKKENFLFGGSIELHELQNLNSLESSDDLSTSLRCKMTIYTSAHQEWGVAWYNEIKQDGVPVKVASSHSHLEKFMTLQKIEEKHYVVIVTYEDKQIAIGMVLNDFFDDLRLSSNMRDFEERFAKLQNFKESFISDNNREKNSQIGNIKAEEDKNSAQKECQSEDFNIEQDEETEDDDFGEFVAG